VLFRIPGPQDVRLLPGDLIGRIGGAALRVDDPRISEVHAYVSLRRGGLVLLALRGRLAVDGRVVTEVALRPGVQFEIAPGLSLEVVDVVVPSAVLGVEGDGLPRQPIPGTCALRLDPEPTLAPGVHDGALLQLWGADDGWRGQIPGQPPMDVRAGASFVFHGRAFRFVDVPIGATSAPETSTGDRLDAPLVIVDRFDTVHVQRAGRTVAVLSGRAARVVSELASFEAPVPWTLLCEQIWGPDEPAQQRPRLDVTLARLRTRLLAAGVRADLVRTDGCGNIELFLHEADRVAEDG
jgi:hypothetical protein